MQFSISPRWRLVGWLAAATVTGAAAQTPTQPQPPVQALAAPPAQRPDPLNAQTEVPPAVHQPAFAAYRAAAEPQVGSWKAANDTVTRIGGWRAYAREAAAPAPAVAAPAAAGAASRSPAGHHGHGKP